MELDIFVQMPRSTPVTGDNVLYSTRPYVGQGNGRPPVVGPVQSGERQMNQVSFSFQANQDATVKLQFWDINAGAWVTWNNNGAGDSAPATGGPFNGIYQIPHGGDWQVVASFLVAPTTWKVPSGIRLSKVKQ